MIELIPGVSGSLCFLVSLLCVNYLVKLQHNPPSKFSNHRAKVMLTLSFMSADK